MLTLSEKRQISALEMIDSAGSSSFLVATPQIRNMATLGGNILLDTRCNYYDQSYEWRKSINFCLKKDGTTCWSHRKFEVHGSFLDRHRPGPDGARCSRPAGLEIGRARSASFDST